MYECSPVPPPWAPILNRMGLVWVPSQHSKNLLVEGGVETPIMVCGYGIDPSAFYPIDRKGRDGPMKFIAWAQGLSSRKNALMSARAFLAAKLPEDEAVLEIKLNDGQGTPYFKDPDGNVHPNIWCIAANWDTRQVGDWLRGADCFIYLSAGEGFGLKPLEAMGTGLPVICTYNTGMKEYLTGQNALLVFPRFIDMASDLGENHELAEMDWEYNLQPILKDGRHTDLWAKPILLGQAFEVRQTAHSYIHRFNHPCTFDYPDFDEAVAHIRWAFEHRDELYEIGQRGAETAQELTWARAGEKAFALLKEHYSR